MRLSIGLCAAQVDTPSRALIQLDALFTLQQCAAYIFPTLVGVTKKQ